MRKKFVAVALGGSVLAVSGVTAASGVFLAADRTPIPHVATSSTPASQAKPSALAATVPVVLKACADFWTQSAATAYLKVTPAASSSLDSNGNGIACEAKFAPPKPTVVAQPTVTAKAACPTDQGPISGNWCMHSANGPDNVGYVPYASPPYSGMTGGYDPMEICGGENSAPQCKGQSTYVPSGQPYPTYSNG